MGKKLTWDEVIDRFMEKHGDRYGYELVEYIDIKTKVWIYCEFHGYFDQIPDDHMRGKGCRYCYGHLRRTTEQFIEKAKEIHQDDDGNYLYDYSKVEYDGSHEYIILICLTCEYEFEQTAYCHLDGQGCPKCAGNMTKTTEEFVNEAKSKHQDEKGNCLYNYDKVVYISGKIKVIIYCISCKQDFEQVPSSHVNQLCGCPNCDRSKTERLVGEMLEKITDLKFLINNYPKFLITEDYKNGLELDFYNKEFKFAVEVNGIQHYEYTPYFHNKKENAFEKQQERDKTKKQLCKDNNITLLSIPHWYNYRNKKKLYNYIICKLDKLKILEKLEILVIY
jgi:hypothetical protein